LKIAVNGQLRDLRIETRILHHSQEQAFRPVPQENSLFVEQAGKPVHKKLIENGATSQSKPS
jgi:hypothetical protein